jgi:hypothetical protein
MKNRFIVAAALAVGFASYSGAQTQSPTNTSAPASAAKSSPEQTVAQIDRLAAIIGGSINLDQMNLLEKWNLDDAGPNPRVIAGRLEFHVNSIVWDGVEYVSAESFGGEFAIIQSKASSYGYILVDLKNDHQAVSDKILQSAYRQAYDHARNEKAAESLAIRAGEFNRR